MRTRAAALACIAGVAGQGAVLAQGYPTKPDRIVVPRAPGSQSELFARMLGQKMSEGLGQPVVDDSAVAASGMELIPGSPDQFATHIKSEIARFTAMAKAAGIKLD